MKAHVRFRAHPRTALAAAVVVRKSATGRRLPAELVNVALGGAGIVLGEPLAPGEAVVLEVAPPTRWEPVPLLATVAWCAPFGNGSRAGLQFDHRDAASVGALVELSDAPAAR